MKHAIPILVAAVCFVASAGAVPAGDNLIVKGEVVDVACSTEKGHGGQGDAHAACAMGCARRGNQMAILTPDEVYLIEGDYAANSNAKLLDFVARHVEAKGSISEKNGRKVITVSAMAVAK
jgi:hypothetical protein